MIVDPASAPTSGEGGMHSLHLSVAGGLTQSGACLDRLQPGAWSSFPHWHDSEDEFILGPEGHATLRDDAGITNLGPGDAVCWPHGEPNGHHLTNRGAGRCRYLIVGARGLGDICTYPDDGRRPVNGTARWQIIGADGAVQPKRIANADFVQSRTDAPIRYFIAGTTLPEAACHYPDIDRHYARRGGMSSMTHKDGTPYTGWPKETQS